MINWLLCFIGVHPQHLRSYVAAKPNALNQRKKVRCFRCWRCQRHYWDY